MSAGVATARTGARTFVLSEAFALLALVLVDVLLRLREPLDVPRDRWLGVQLVACWLAALWVLRRVDVNKATSLVFGAALLGLGGVLELRALQSLAATAVDVGSVHGELGAVELAVHALHAAAALVVLPFALGVVKKQPGSGALAAALTFARFTCAAGLVVAGLVSWGA
ncbi:MAG: hypothetical protein JST54_14740 [Deltaproteobacteria bacterium]|nr:hypothetical protein [Deltaproteobacteria bacterium]